MFFSNIIRSQSREFNNGQFSQQKYTPFEFWLWFRVFFWNSAIYSKKTQLKIYQWFDKNCIFQKKNGPNYSFQWHHQLFSSNLILPYLIINYSPECISDEIGTKYTSLMKQNIKTVNVIRKMVAWFSWAIFIRWHWVMKKTIQ